MNRPGATDDTELAGHSDVGQRKHNEDAYLVDPTLGLYVVADGVGGHQSGEIASAITIEVLRREIAAGNDLASAIQLANTAVRAGVREGRGKAGMATTVVAMRQRGDAFDLAWVGDSRAYLWDGKLKLLTRDHSYVEAQLAAGAITLEEARTHPRRHVILQAIGLQEEGAVRVGTNTGRLGPGNTILLCSDGVSDPLDNEQLSHLLGRDTDAQATCNSLVITALQCGGKDNATAVVLRYQPGRDAAPATVDKVTWVFDPESNAYEGAPDATPQQGDAAQDVEVTQVMSARPRAREENSAPDTAAAGGGHTGGIGWPWIWGVAIVGTLAGLALVYALR